LIRKQREDVALRALRAATEVLKAAEQHLERCKHELNQVTDQISAQGQLLSQALASGEALIQKVKQHRARMEWLNDNRKKAATGVQDATEKVAAAQSQANLLKQEHLRVRAKCEAVEVQIAQHRKQERALEENRLAAAVEELSIVASA
jgi:ABC-type transporter Mla subunit MlaD